MRDKCLTGDNFDQRMDRDSDEPAAPVVSPISSYWPFNQTSTVGNEALFLLEGYRTGKYPPAFCSLYFFQPNRTGIRSWWNTYGKLNLTDEREAIRIVHNTYPELEVYPSDELPPRSIRTEKAPGGWYVAFIQEGSGLPILSAQCYYVVMTGRSGCPEWSITVSWSSYRIFLRRGVDENNYIIFKKKLIITCGSRHILFDPLRTTTRTSTRCATRTRLVFRCYSSIYRITLHSFGYLKGNIFTTTTPSLFYGTSQVATTLCLCVVTRISTIVPLFRCAIPASWTPTYDYFPSAAMMGTCIIPNLRIIL
jgi:hypothetical protein